MKKLNSKGFAHQILIMAVLVMVAIGGIGGFVYLHSSSAETASFKPDPETQKSINLCGGGSWGWWIVKNELTVKGSAARVDYMGNRTGGQCAVVRSGANYPSQTKVLSVSIHVRNASGSYNKTLKSNTGTVKSYLNAIHLTHDEAKAACLPVKYYSSFYFAVYASLSYNGNKKTVMMPTTPGDTEIPDCSSLK